MSRGKWLRAKIIWFSFGLPATDPLCDMRPLNVSRTGSGRREAWTKSDNWDTVGLVWSGTKRVINLPNWSSRFNFDPHSTENHPFLRGTCLFNYSPSQLTLPFVVQCGKVNFFLFSFESEEFLPISRFFESYNIMSSYVKLIQKYFLLLSEKMNLFFQWVSLEKKRKEYCQFSLLHITNFQRDGQL